MSKKDFKWKCDICGVGFNNFHAQGFDNKIYCPLCYYKHEFNQLQQENQKYKEVIDKLKQEINSNMYAYDDGEDCGVDCCCDGFKLLNILKEVE